MVEGLSLGSEYRVQNIGKNIILRYNLVKSLGQL